MTMRRCWAPNTPDPWCRAALLFLLAGSLSAQSEVDRLARALREKPTPAAQAALERFAASARGEDAALANLALGVTAVEDENAAAALRHLTAAQRALPSLADYVAFGIASAHSKAKNPQAVLEAIEPVWRNQPVSPMLGRAAVLGAQAYIDIGQPARALDLLQRYNGQVPQPQGLLVTAKAQEAAGDIPSATATYQAVYYGYPQTPEALEAKADATRTVAPARLRLDRAARLMANRGTAIARPELELMVASLSGPDGDIARARLGGADYILKRNEQALRYLQGLSLEYPEANAERLYYIAACLRRLDRDAQIPEVIEELGRVAPQSPWRLKALILIGNKYLLENDPARFLPLYQACADAFPDSDEAPTCHWRVAWRAYLDRQPSADPLLREHLRRYPSSDKAGASLYWLARLAEQRNDLPGAKRFYQELIEKYPNFYYTMLGRENITKSAVAAAAPSPETEAFLRQVRFPERPSAAMFQASPGFAQRQARARLLSRAALDVWCDAELRYAARVEGQAYPAAIEAAELAVKRGKPEQGMRYIKALATNYLWVPYAMAPEKFWRLAFPWPYRSEIHMWAVERGLDEYMLAGLIRQESEFEAKIVSYAGARGLTQVMPSTGRELARRTGMKGYSTPLLFQPRTNLRLGTYYLKDLINSLDGSIEQALASYNGGRANVVKWREWAQYREPAELVENMPLNQTRDYVQIIVRNGEMYRRLYGNDPPPPPPAPEPKPAPPAPAKKGKPRAKR